MRAGDGETGSFEVNDTKRNCQRAEHKSRNEGTLIGQQRVGGEVPLGLQIGCSLEIFWLELWLARPAWPLGETGLCTCAGLLQGVERVQMIVHHGNMVQIH